jgi:toxoflavin biosynthesis protein ToxC
MSIRHFAPISGVATISKQLVATAGYDNQIILWEAATQVPIGRVNHDHLVNQCEFSYDGQLLISASSDHTGRIWSVPDMQLLTVLRGHTDDVMQASFAPDGKRVATCSYDRTLRVFDLQGNCLAICQGHMGLIEAFAWNVNGSELTSCGTDGTIRTWCSYTGTMKNLHDGFQHDIDALVFASKDYYFVGTDEGSIILYVNSQPKAYPANTSGVKKLVKRENHLLSIGYDQQVILWQILPDMKLEKICSDRLPSNVWARSAAFLNQETIVFASFGSTYISWYWPSKEWSCKSWHPSISINALTTQQEDILSIGDAGQLFRNKSLIADVGSLCNCIVQFDKSCLVGGQTGTIFDTFNQNQIIFQHSSSINCCTFYIDDKGRKNIIFGAYDGSLIFLIQNSESSQFQVETIKLECNAIKGVAVYENQILCGSADGTLSIIDGIHRNQIKSIKNAHDSILNGVTFYRDGFVTVSRDRTMRLWGRQGELKKILLTRHPKSIKCVATDPSGRLTASGSYGGTVSVYDHQLEQWTTPLKRLTMSGISSLVWSNQSSCFIAASYDGGYYYV